MLASGSRNTRDFFSIKMFSCSVFFFFSLVPGNNPRYINVFGCKHQHIPAWPVLCHSSEPHLIYWRPINVVTMELHNSWGETKEGKRDESASPLNFQWNVNVQRQKAKGVVHWNQRLRSEVKTTRLNADICLHVFQRGAAWFKTEFQRRKLGVDLAGAASNVRWLNIFLSP